MNSTLLAEDGEADFATSDKKHPSDFALRKFAKPGELKMEQLKQLRSRMSGQSQHGIVRLCSMLIRGPDRALLMMLSIVAEAWHERVAAEKSSREDGKERAEG